MEWNFKSDSGRLFVYSLERLNQDHDLQVPVCRLAGDHDDPQEIKNARLIAAAPQGVDLVRRLWAFIENGDTSDDFFSMREQVRNYLTAVEG